MKRDGASATEQQGGWFVPFWALLRRELLGTWISPVAWVVWTAFLLLQGGIFYSITVHFSYLVDAGLESGPLEAYFGQQSLLLSMTLLLVCPALTMRTFAEERRSGAIELLSSSPVAPSAIVLAKYLGVLVTYVAFWAPTGLYVALLRGTGTLVPGAIGASYLGIFLVGASYLAVGVLMSALSRSQIVALILTILVEFGLFVVGLGEYVLDPGPARDVSLHVSLTTLLTETSRGLVDTRRLALHLGLTVWALFACVRAVDSWRGRTGPRHVLSAVAVLALFVAQVEVNVLAARHYQRFDLSRDGRFSLSEESRRILDELDAPVEIIVLLGAEEPLLVDVRHLLDAYRAASRKVVVRYVDPERNAAEFLALGKQYDVGADESTGGLVVAEAAMIVRRGSATRFVRHGELVAQDEEGRRVPRLEAAVSEALLRVGGEEDRKVCFVVGHGEKSLGDYGPEGLSELGRRLEHQNLSAIEANLDTTEPARSLEGCHLIALVGPARPLPPEHTRAVRSALERGAAFFGAFDPIVDGRGTLTAPNVEEIETATGTRVVRGFVLERDGRARLPQGFGEAFFAHVEKHPITAGLSTEGERPDGRVVVLSAAPIELRPDVTGAVLLRTSEQATVLGDLTVLGDPGADEEGGRTSVGVATRATGSTVPGPSERRAVVLGTSNLADNASLREPSLLGNRRFVEGSFAWLASRPGLSSVPDGKPLPPGLSLSEDSLGALLRYVLVFMPGTVALLGAFVLLRRRSAEARSRDGSSAQPGGNP